MLQSQKCKDEVSQLNHKILQLGEEASVHQAQDEKNLINIQLLTQRLEEAGHQEELQVSGLKTSATALKCLEVGSPLR